MTFTRKMTGVALTFTAILLGALLMSGCGQHNPVAPVTTNGGEDIKHGGDQLFAAGGLYGTLDSLVSFTQALVTVKAGGVVRLGMAGRIHALIVAPNSVSRDALITVKTTTFNIAGRTVVTFDFGPDGLRFLPSAKLTVDASLFGSGRPNFVRLFWFNPESHQWTLQETRQPRFGTVVFNIYHFSKYGIS